MYNKRIFFYLIFFVLVIWELIDLTLARPSTYDQSQSGDVNVHIDVQDVDIVALINKGLFDDTEYDFYYDYDDFTIKPITKPTAATTTKPLSTTWPTRPAIISSSLSSAITNSDINYSNNSDSISTTVSSSSLSSSVAPTVAAVVQNESITIINEPLITSNTSKNDSIITNENKSKLILLNDQQVIVKNLGRKCRSGTLPNGNGRCRKISRRRMSILPLLTRESPKFNQKNTSKDIEIISWISPRF